MKRILGWRELSNVALIGLVVLVTMTWQAAELPERQVVADSGPVLLQDSDVVAEASSTPTAEIPVSAAVAAMATVVPLASPTATKPATQVVAPPVVTRVVRVPILMYHRIDGLPPNADEIRKSLSVAPSVFDSQVRFLKERGFAAVSLYEVYDALQEKSALPPKPVVLTFDDGYLDNHANAFPVLKRYGFSGTFFVLTDLAGTGEYMSWSQLREMAEAGMKIEVHGRTHADLTRLTPAGMASQARGGKEAIRAQLGIDPMFYCYPSGKYSADVIEAVKASGFWGATTINYGTEHALDKRFELKRVRIDGRDSFSAFARKVGETP